MIACAVAAGLLAVYPADVLSGRTLLLEPWMNLALPARGERGVPRGPPGEPAVARLGGRGVRLRRRDQVLGGGPRGRAARRLPDRAAAGADVTGQARGRARSAARWAASRSSPGRSPSPTRRGSSTRRCFTRSAGSARTRPLSLRLAHLTGLIDVLSRDGKLAAPGTTTHSLFAMGAEASTHTVAVGWPAYAAAAVGIALIAAGYLTAGSRQRTPLEWFALVTAVLATAAIMWYSAFFYHYPDFPAPWLAIAVGDRRRQPRLPDPGQRPPGQGRAARPRRRRRRRDPGRRGHRGPRTGSPRTSRRVPRACPRWFPQGSCLVADQVSFAIAANRFAAPSPGCPDVIDSLATTLALSGGVSPQGGAGQRARVVAGWEAIFGKASTCGCRAASPPRIPWTPALQSWFSAHFRLLAAYPGYGASKLYVRDH